MTEKLNTDEDRAGKWVGLTAEAFLAVEHAAYIALGVLLAIAALVALAGATFTLISNLTDWTSTAATFLIIDRLLFVLMLIEILHTVRASMRSGALTSEPFLVVGLIATIRRVLVITLKSSETTKTDTMSDAALRMFHASMVELGVLAVLILVMVCSIWLLRRDKPG